MVDDGPSRARYVGDDANGEEDTSETASSVDGSSGDFAVLFETLRVGLTNAPSDSPAGLLSWLLLMYRDKLSQNASLAKLSEVGLSSVWSVEGETCVAEEADEEAAMVGILSTFAFLARYACTIVGVSSEGELGGEDSGVVELS